MTAGRIAIVLWALTIGAALFYLVRGRTRTSADSRRSVVVTGSEKDMVLAEMRNILAAVQGVLLDVSTGDMAAASKAAKSAGMVMASEDSAGLLAKLPLDFKTLGLGLHR